MLNGGFFGVGDYRYKDTKQPYRGLAQRIELGPGEVRYYDGSGRELIQLGAKEPQQPTKEQLFYNNSWREA